MSRFHVNLVVLCSVLLLSSCLFKPLDFDEDKWKETVENTRIEDLYKNNLKGDEFINPWLVQNQRSFSGFLRWRMSTTARYSQEAEDNRPRVVPNLMDRIEALDPDTDFITWIGHATFLMRIHGEYWLTDPILTERALLPKRVPHQQ
jgi:N-acyl-phosphatidylethanolamine-hydrolysing phospholipase D